jgi:hypothetical protein
MLDRYGINRVPAFRIATKSFQFAPLGRIQGKHPAGEALPAIE